jgi:hypothetical protein
VHPAAGVALEDQVAGTRVIDRIHPSIDRSTRAGSTKPLTPHRARDAL